jgi:hypothetical protein
MLPWLKLVCLGWLCVLVEGEFKLTFLVVGGERVVLVRKRSQNITDYAD